MSLPKRTLAAIKGKGFFTAIEIRDLLNEGKPISEHITTIQAHSALKYIHKHARYISNKEMKGGLVSIQIIDFVDRKKNKAKQNLINAVLFGSKSA